MIFITPFREIHVQVGLAPTPPGLDLRRAHRISGIAPATRWHTDYPFAPRARVWTLLTDGVRSAQRKTPDALVGALPLAKADSGV